MKQPQQPFICYVAALLSMGCKGEGSEPTLTPLWYSVEVEFPEGTLSNTSEKSSQTEEGVEVDPDSAAYLWRASGNDCIDTTWIAGLGVFDNDSVATHRAVAVTTTGVQYIGLKPLIIDFPERERQSAMDATVSGALSEGQLDVVVDADGFCSRVDPSDCSSADNMSIQITWDNHLLDPIEVPGVAHPAGLGDGNDIVCVPDI